MSVSKCLSFLRVFLQESCWHKNGKVYMQSAYYIVVGDGETGNNVNVHQERQYPYNLTEEVE